MRSASSELLLDTKQQQLRKKKLLELAAAKNQKRGTPRTFREKVWFYSTMSFAMIAVGSGSALLFLVPLYVDPAVSTLLADFDPEPVQCKTVRHEQLTGLYNCTWSSCREGCTSDMYNCSHIYVVYKTAGGGGGGGDSGGDIGDAGDDGRRGRGGGTGAGGYDNGRIYEREAVLLVNIKGCGYPPAVVCSNFTKAYGQVGFTFPCHYSRQNYTLTMVGYDKRQQYADIVHFFAVPFTICVITSIVLCVMHCDCQSTATASRPSEPSRSSAGHSHTEGFSDHSISTRVERLDEAMMEQSRALGEPSGL
ncbi:Na+ channel auxiliary subunit TipE [Cinara cedri]|uniref:Na+ channel auxiliary subunit TipE n=1 Tax=Cinara cedri TaxID=506608 RepID=A0A5E4NI21_9HEMI|nr:Na+ channel auxiliary subunit TipE [Cinara cedri]